MALFISGSTKSKMAAKIFLVTDYVVCAVVAMTEATAGTEEETVTLVLRRTTCGVVGRAGTPWRTIGVTTGVTTGEVAEDDGEGREEVAVVGRRGPAMTAVGVG